MAPLSWPKLAKIDKFARLCPSLRGDYSAGMKRIKNAAKRTKHVLAQDGYFRRFVRQLFSSWMKRQSGNYRKEIEKIAEKLQDIESSIEIIARQMARQEKREE